MKLYLTWFNSYLKGVRKCKVRNHVNKIIPYIYFLKQTQRKRKVHTFYNLPFIPSLSICLMLIQSGLETTLLCFSGFDVCFAPIFLNFTKRDNSYIFVPIIFVPTYLKILYPPLINKLRF